MKRIVVHIDRLALHGLAPHEARAVRDALRAELGDLLAQPGQSEQAGRQFVPLHLEAAPAQRVVVAPTPAALGRAAAGAVATAIGAGTGGDGQ